MKRPKFTPGAKRPGNKPFEQSLDDDLFSGEKAQPIKKRFDQNEKNEESKTTTTLYARDVPVELMDKLKDIVYTEKVSSDPFANQSKVIIEAISFYMENYKNEIIERPDWVKEQENKKARR